MERFWSDGDDRMWLEGDRVRFDTAGTPMDQEWSISVADFLDPRDGAVARVQALRGFGEEGLRKLLARLGGPTFEEYAAGTVPTPFHFISRERRGPSELAVKVMCDVLARAALPFPSFKMESRSTIHQIDGADCEAQEWTYAGKRDGVEAYVQAETSWWNPTTVNQQSVTLAVLDRRAGFRSFYLSSSPPWDKWEARGTAALVEKEWLESRLENAALTWLIRG